MTYRVATPQRIQWDQKMQHSDLAPDFQPATTTESGGRYHQGFPSWRESTLSFDEQGFPERAINNHLLTRAIERLSRFAFVYPPRALAKRLIKPDQAKRYIRHLGQVEAFAQDFPIISFDFFDTLVVREVEPPDLVKRKTAEFVSIALLDKGIAITPAHFQLIRDHIELRLRKESIEKDGLDHETSILTVITNTLIACGVPQPGELAQQIINYEMETELHCLQLHEGAYDILAKLTALGKKLIIVSDMYMRHTDIKRICCAFGIEKFISHIFVSSDQRLAKYSGRIFDYVLENINATPDQIIHVGDNHHSDFFAPSMKSIQSLWLYQPKNLLRRLQHRSKLEKNIIFNYSNSSLNSDIERLLFQSIAPATIAFAYKALLDAHRLGLKKLLFVAREGVFLKEVFSAIQSQTLLFSNLEQIQFEILYSSRASSICATYSGLSNYHALIEKTAYRFGSFSVSNFLKTYNIKHDDLSSEAVNFFANCCEEEKPNSFFSRLQNSSIGREIHELLSTRASLFEKYLNQLGIGQTPVGLVDVGWGGTIQQHITLALKQQSPDAKVYGFYLGTNSGIHELLPYQYRSRILSGYILNETDNDPRTLQITTALPLIELCFTNPELKTTLNYVDRINHVEPLFDHKADNAHSHSLYAATKSACLDYASQFCQTANNHVVDFYTLRQQVREPFLNLLVNPSQKQANALGGATFDFGWGDEKDYQLIYPLSKRDIFSPRKLMKSLNQAGWWQGSLAAAGLSILLPAINLFIYIRARHHGINRVIRQVLKVT